MKLEILLLELTGKKAILISGGKQQKMKEKCILPAKVFESHQKVLCEVQKQFAKSFVITYDINKDKYWRSFECFNAH